MTANTEHRVRFLDAWRFIAVCLVIQSHLLIFSGISIVDQYEFVRRFGRFGTLGVSIFFFLSGYVICTGLLVEYNHTQRVSLLAFYARRFFRITPPLALFLIACYVLAKFQLIVISNEQLVNSALYLCNLPVSGGCSWYAGHTWSLAYEEQFYLIFPLLFIWLFWKSHSRKFFLFIWAGFIFMSLLFKSVGWDLAGGYLSNMSFLLTGVVAAFYKNELFQRLHQTTLAHWLATGSIFLMAVFLLPYSVEKYSSTLIYPLLIGYLVLATPVHSSGFSLFFENYFICYLGRISYTVYLWQQLATAKYEYLPLIWYPIMIVAVWVFAHYSFKFFETPLIHYASGLSRRIKERGLNKGSDASGY